MGASWLFLSSFFFNLNGIIIWKLFFSINYSYLSMISKFDDLKCDKNAKSEEICKFLSYLPRVWVRFTWWWLQLEPITILMTLCKLLYIFEISKLLKVYVLAFWSGKFLMKELWGKYIILHKLNKLFLYACVSAHPFSLQHSRAKLFFLLLKMLALLTLLLLLWLTAVTGEFNLGRLTSWLTENVKCGGAEETVFWEMRWKKQFEGLNLLSSEFTVFYPTWLCANFLYLLKWWHK